MGSALHNLAAAARTASATTCARATLPASAVLSYGPNPQHITAGTLTNCFSRSLFGSLASLALPMGRPLVYAGDAATGGFRRSPRKTSAATKNQIPCVDPGTQELLGYVPAMSAAQV